jgi:hypothetical protein
VRRKIDRDGGSIQHGWSIWERPGIFIEGIFHAVWISPDGTLIDVTPEVDNEKEILFLPDPVRIFDEQKFNRLNNIRMAILDHPLVHDFLKTVEEYVAYQISNTVPGQPRTQQLDVDVCTSYEQRMAQLEMQIGQLTPGRNDLCICGSGRKFKKCCGRF